MRYILIIVTFFTFFACKSGDKIADGEKEEDFFQPSFSPGPTTFVYKTKKDYSNFVPVILSEDKKSIVSYPHPKDLIIDGFLTLPTKLNDGYLLDKRGINKNVAFLSLTYSEYARLDQAPGLEDLYQNIQDFNPLKELCNCGNRNSYEDLENQLNEIISKNQLDKSCKRIL